MRTHRIPLRIGFLALFVACGAEVEDSAAPVVAPILDELELPSPSLRRLNQDQYRRAVTGLLGEGLVLPTSLEPDASAGGLIAIGASLTTISPRGVEQYERAAFDLAAQALDTEERRQALVPCVPSGTVDEACASTALSAMGLAAWRRPLSEDEVDRLVDLSTEAATVLGDFHDGLEYGIAALIQSPYFLFRVELGEVDEAGVRRFDDYEMATRLSYLLWNTGPDQALFAAAKAGDLRDDAGLEAQVDRLIADERFEHGLRAVFTDMLHLYKLDALNKDPTLFTHMSPEVGPAAREETLLGIVDLVIDSDGDFRDLLTRDTTFLNRKLASIYNVRAPAREGFGPTTLAREGGRRGLLGQASFLALNSHAVSSSATLRGQFVREVLLCQSIPPPPSDVDTSIPEPSADAATMRERVKAHLEDEYCAGCHQITDIIGLGFENFDGLGHWRTQEVGVQIDPSGELDGTWFADAWELGGVVAKHPALPSCMVQTMLSYASGHSLGSGEDQAVEVHTWHFEDSGFSVATLIKQIAMSPAFRQAGELE